MRKLHLGASFQTTASLIIKIAIVLASLLINYKYANIKGKETGCIDLVYGRP